MAIRDYTQGNIRKNLLYLAFPMMLEMIMQSTFNIIDLFWVSRLGANAIAAVSIAGIYMVIIFSISMGLSVAANALISRHIGAGEKIKANNIILQVALIAFILSTILGILGLFYSPLWLKLIGTKTDVVLAGTNYMKVMFAGSFSIIFLFVINAIFRSAGEAKTAMWILVFTNVLNLVLDPILIFGFGSIPSFGIEGAAAATVLSRSIGILIQIGLLLKGSKIVSFQGIKLKVDLRTQWNITKISVPGSAQLLLRSLSILAIMRIVAIYGTFAVAAYGIALKLFQLILMPGFGMGNASAVLVGQNLGAKKPERSEKSAWIASLYNSLFMGTVAIFFFLFAGKLIAIFDKTPEIVEFGIQCIKIVIPSYVFAGTGIVISRSLMGAGDTISPTIINAITLWLIQLPMAYYLAVILGFHTTGIWWAIFMANILNTAFSVFWFKLGRWKKIAF